MDYFQIRIDSKIEGSSDLIVVDNFHPRWKEAAKKILETRIVELMNKYAQETENWSKVPLSVEFSEEYGLTHIKTYPRQSLDLYPDDEKYRSHNIHSVEEVGAVIAVITEYINQLNFVLKDL